MGRLIDADELLKAVDHEREYLLARGQKGAEHILVHNFRDLIDNAPTVECTWIMSGKRCGKTEEALEYLRPHGKWIINTDKYGVSYICPFCGKEVAGTDLNFCVKCGAKMDKGEDNEG
jgi:hypothetical protein